MIYKGFAHGSIRKKRWYNSSSCYCCKSATLIFHPDVNGFLNIPQRLMKPESLCKTKIFLSHFSLLTWSSHKYCVLQFGFLVLPSSTLWVCHTWRIQDHNFLMHYLHLWRCRICRQPAQWNKVAAQYSSFPYIRHKVGYCSVPRQVEILNHHEFQLMQGKVQVRFSVTASFLLHIVTLPPLVNRISTHIHCNCV